MEVRFEDDKLKRLWSDPDTKTRLPQGIVKLFRRRIQYIRAADDERDFYALRSLKFEEMKSAPGIYSMELNKQYRLELEFDGTGRAKVVNILRISDHYKGRKR